MSNVISHILVLTGLFAYVSQLSAQSLDENQFTLGVNGGVVLGDAAEQYTGHLGVEVGYFRLIRARKAVGLLISYNGYIADTDAMERDGDALEDEGLIVAAASFRAKIIGNLIVGPDVGWAVSTNDQLESGFYFSPKVSYHLKRFVPYAGPKIIFQSGTNVTSLSVGVNFLINYTKK